MPDEQQPTPAGAKAKLEAEVKKIPPTTDRNLLAAASYVWILSLVMLVVRKDDPFIQLHAKQAVVLFLMSLVGFIPIVGWLLGALALVGMVLGFLNAWQGKEYKIPYVYGWSQHIRF